MSHVAATAPAAVTVTHRDTCVACYLTDHHNRPGEALIGVPVYRSTRVHEVRAMLHDEARDAFGVERDRPEGAALTAAINAAFAGTHPLKAFDRSLDAASDDEGDEPCQAWFLITWPVSGDDEGDDAPAPVSAEPAPAMVAQPQQQQQASAARAPLAIVPGPRHLHPTAAAAITKAYGRGRNFMTPNLVGFTMAGAFACELSSGEGFRDRATGLAPTIYGVTVVTRAGAKTDLGACFTHRAGALAYLGRLARLSQYRARRAIVVTAAWLNRCNMLSAMAEADMPAIYAGQANVRALSRDMAALRAEYADVFERFGIDCPEAQSPEPAPIAATTGQLHTAARMVAQPCQQQQACAAPAAPARVTFDAWRAAAIEAPSFHACPELAATDLGSAEDTDDAAGLVFTMGTQAGCWPLYVTRTATGWYVEDAQIVHVCATRELAELVCWHAHAPELIEGADVDSAPPCPTPDSEGGSVGVYTMRYGFGPVSARPTPPLTRAALLLEDAAAFEREGDTAQAADCRRLAAEASRADAIELA